MLGLRVLQFGVGLVEPTLSPLSSDDLKLCHKGIEFPLQGGQLVGDRCSRLRGVGQFRCHLRGVGGLVLFGQCGERVLGAAPCLGCRRCGVGDGIVGYCRPRLRQLILHCHRFRFSDRQPITQQGCGRRLFGENTLRGTQGAPTGLRVGLGLIESRGSAEKFGSGDTGFDRRPR